MINANFDTGVLVVKKVNSELFEGLKNGVKHGAHTTYYEDGTEHVAGFYNEGQKSATWMYYDRYGQRERQENYKDGRPNGKWMEWHANKKVKSESTYVNGRLNGKVIKRDRTGKVLYEAIYKNGKRMKVITKGGGQNQGGGFPNGY